MSADAFRVSGKVPVGNVDLRVRLGIVLAEMAIDRILAIDLCKFEQSLIDNQCPGKHLELMLEWHHDYMQEWRTRALEDVRGWLVTWDEK